MLFFEKVGECVEFIKDKYILNSVTTTSPLIAKFIKENFKGIDVRAFKDIFPVLKARGIRVQIPKLTGFMS